MIDEDPDLRDLLGLLLRSEGYEVEMAESGLAALRARTSIQV